MNNFMVSVAGIMLGGYTALTILGGRKVVKDADNWHYKGKEGEGLWWVVVIISLNVLTK